RGALTQNSLEWGHPNSAGYACTIGYFNNGAPFIGFNIEASTTGNKFRTRGIRGGAFQSNNSTRLGWGSGSNSNADNQDLTAILTLPLDAPGLSSNDTTAATTAFAQAHARPYFVATTNVAQSLSSSVFTKVQMNVETLDSDSCYDPTTNYRFTP